MFIISSISIKNNIATFVLYIRREHSIIVKTDYYSINVLFTEAKLFTMRCDISQVSQIQDIIHIIVVITNVILVAKRKNPNITITVKVVNDRLGFILFSFSFMFLYFILSFFFLFFI